MKCPQCSVNHRRQYGMKCKCGYQFALDPRVNGMTDGRMLFLIRKASANDTFFFTENQLYTSFCRFHRGSSASCVVAVFIVGFFSLLATVAGFAAMIIIPFLIVIGILGVAAFRSRKPSREKFQRCLATYRAQHGKPPRLIDVAQLATPPPEYQEPDLYDYGVERILVVQRDLLVDLLVKNGFHQTQRALILSGNGYPDYLTPIAVKALEENPQLPVFFLHDATTEGVAWYKKMLNSTRLPWHNHPCTDLGVYPDDLSRVGRIKSLRPENDHYALPVDALPIAMLCAGLDTALERQVPLRELLAANHLEQDHGSTGSFG